MPGYHFGRGIHYFLQLGTPHFPSLVEAFKKNSPETNGRGVNFVFIDPKQLGRKWKEGSVYSVPLHQSTKAKIREWAPDLPDDRVKDIETRIDQYNADEELLFCFIAGELIYTTTVRIQPTHIYK
jgi:hypothetical protein